MRNYTTTTTIGGTPASGVSIWVSTDPAGASVIASGATSTLGVKVFAMDDGAYYVWRQRNGATWTQPEAITVSALSVASTLDGTAVAAATLATVAELKAILGVATADTTLDAILQAVLEDASSAMCGPEGAGRELVSAERTELYRAERGARTIWLRCRPVSEIAEVIEAAEGDFDNEEALGADDDYWCDLERGELHRVGCNWLPDAVPTVKVTYTAGYASIPADLRRACLMQAVNDYSNRLSPGAQTAGAGGGNVGLSEPAALLPQVAEVCRRYRRLG